MTLGKKTGNLSFNEVKSMRMADMDSKTFAVMQPYFLPYIGYFQLIQAVDFFVIADNYKYTKKGWINRNQISTNGKSERITIPLKNGPDSMKICDREISDIYDPEKIMRKIRNAYGSNPSRENLMREVLSAPEVKLDKFLIKGMRLIASELCIKTEFLFASDFLIPENLSGTEKIFYFSRELNCFNYVNPIGGLELYSKNDFFQNGVSLRFLRAADELIKEGSFSIAHNLYKFSSKEVSEQLSKFELI